MVWYVDFYPFDVNKYDNIYGKEFFKNKHIKVPSIIRLDAFIYNS